MKFIGFVSVENKERYLLEDYLPHLGRIEDIKQIISDNKVVEVVIAIESTEHCKIKNIINKLQGVKAVIKVIPDMYDILIGKVRMSAIFGMPLIEINHNIMPVWQQHFKRVIDIVFSILALIVLSPLYLFIALGVKFSSPGPILYSHYRVGRRFENF